MPTPSPQIKRVEIGPTWKTDADGKPVVPALTLGWHVVAWVSKWLQRGNGEVWGLTGEQFRFLLHWYAVDDQLRFVYRDGVLQRMKGWG